MKAKMKFTELQSGLMRKLAKGDILRVRIGRSTSTWQFDILRGTEGVFIGRIGVRHGRRSGRLTIATVEALARMGALRLLTPENEVFRRDYEPTADGLSVADTEMTVEELETLNVAIDRRAAQGRGEL